MFKLAAAGYLRYENSFVNSIIEASQIMPCQDLASAVCLDLQTSGASPAHGTILEWGLALPATAECPANTLSEIAKKPDTSESLPRRISKLTGISAAAWEQAPRTSDCIWQDWCQTHQLALRPLVIHYARFEKAFLSTLTPLDDLRIVCSYDIARRLYPDLPSKSLRSLSGYLGMPLAELKRAEDHVAGNMFVWQQMRQTLAQEGITTYEDLQSWFATTKPPKATKKVYALSETIRLNLPDAPGVYRLLGSGETILYIGKATSLKSRVNSYFRGQKSKGSRLNELVSQVQDIAVTTCPNPLAAAVMESDLIKAIDPPYNRALRNTNDAIAYWQPELAGGVAASNRWGPMRSQSFINYCQHILALIQEGDQIPAQLDLPITEEAIIDAGIKQFIEQYGSCPTPNSLRKLLVRFWCRKINHRRQQTLAQLAEQELGAKPQEPQEPQEQTERLWTADDVRRHLRSTLTRLGFQAHKARWLQRLMDCHMVFRGSDNQWHHGIVTGGQVRFKVRKTLPNWQKLHVASNKPSPATSAFDQATYDRLTILLTELRRLCKSQEEVFLKYQNRGVLQGSEICRFLFPEDYLGHH